MTVFKKAAFLLLLILIIPTTALRAQFANTKIKTKNEAYTDSLKQVEYNYTFPILGQGAYKKGFDIPYPAGIMGNYMWMTQNLVFENLQLGLKTDEVDIPLTDVGFVQFGENTNTSYSINVRPDLLLGIYIRSVHDMYIF